MPRVNPYCTQDDVRSVVPLLLGGPDGESGGEIVNDQTLDSFILRISSKMDLVFLKNGYSVPIEFGVEGDTNYNQLLKENLKGIAINGVAGMVVRASKKSIDNQIERNQFEIMFDRELMLIIDKGLPTARPPSITTAKALAPSTGTRKQVPWFSPQGINYDSR